MVNNASKHLLGHKIIAVKQLLVVRHYDSHVAGRHKRQEYPFNQDWQPKENCHSQHTETAAESDVQRHWTCAVIVGAP